MAIPASLNASRRNAQTQTRQARRRLTVRTLCLGALAVVACSSPRRASPIGDPTAMRVLATILPLLDSLTAASTALQQTVRVSHLDAAAESRMRAAFARARTAYKRVEWWIEAYLPLAAEELNGAPVAEVDLSEGPANIIPPHGFQLLELLLFPRVASSHLAEIDSEAAVMEDYAGRTRRFADSTIMRDQQLFDAVKLEIARIATLGVTGFDSPGRRASLDEARASITGIADALAPYRDSARRDATREWLVADSLQQAAQLALSHAHFDGFDRLGFITSFMNPLAHAVASIRDSLRVSMPQERRLWRADASTPFDDNAFDVEAPCAGCVPALAAQRASLGARLFFDGTLSGSGTRSCATCHQPARAFTDGATRSAALLAGVRLRNAPSLINAALQWAQFTDMRAEFLEDQAADVVANAAEMHGALDVAGRRFADDASYARAFREAFPERGDSALSSRTITAALAAYVRSLTSLGSRADQAMRGDTTQLTSTERLGFNLFAGKARCATCHFLPLTNGTVPPLFARTEVEVIGVPAEVRWRGARVDGDPGRSGVTAVPLQRYAFKTPGLRNVALTAPYMHNGVYRTLDEVVRFYNAGGGAGIGIHLPNQTLSADSLGLTDIEQHALIAFLRALTDSSLFVGRRR